MFIDYLIVLTYVLIVLYAGIKSGSDIKNFSDYSIGQRDFSNFVICAGIFATMVGGGSTMGASEKIFSSGISFTIVLAAFIVSDLIAAKFLAGKFWQYRDCYSVGDIIGKYYGKSGQIFSGVVGILMSIAALAMQVSSMGFLLQYFLDIPHSYGAIIGMGIVIAYCTYGGMKSVTITDVIEFAVLVIAIPMLFGIGTNKVGGLSGIINSVPKEHLSFTADQGKLLRYGSIALVFLVPYMNPVLVQRLLIGKDAKQTADALTNASLLRIPYMFMICCLGFVALILNSSLQADLAFPYLVNEILPVGIRGLVVCGVMAVIMSTADSYLHLCSVLITNDIIKPIFNKSLKDNRTILHTVRVVNVIIGILAIFMALQVKNVMELNFLAFALWMPCISIPLIAAIYGFKVGKLEFFISAICGSATCFIWRFFLADTTNIDSLLPAVIVNASVFFSLYFIKKMILPNKETLFTLTDP